VLWWHGVARFVAPFLLYVLCVMLIPAVSAVEHLDFKLTDNTSAARMFALFSLGFAITAPISGLPFFWWVRRRRAEIRRVVRNGEIVGGVIVSATAWGTRGMFGLSSRLDASHTNLDVTTSLGGTTHYFRVVAPTICSMEAPPGCLATAASTAASRVVSGGLAIAPIVPHRNLLRQNVRLFYQMVTDVMAQRIRCAITRSARSADDDLRRQARADLQRSPELTRLCS